MMTVGIRLRAQCALNLAEMEPMNECGLRTPGVHSLMEQTSYATDWPFFAGQSALVRDLLFCEARLQTSKLKSACGCRLAHRQIGGLARSQKTFASNVD